MREPPALVPLRYLAAGVLMEYLPPSSSYGNLYTP